MAGIELPHLSVRAPELMPLKDVRRWADGEVAANRGYATVDELAAHAVATLDALTPTDRRHRAGPTPSEFDWLPT